VTVAARRVLVGAVLVAGCALGSHTPRRADSGQELEARGFTVRAPRGDGWYLVQHEADTVHFSKETDAGNAHTVLAFVATADSPTPINGRGALRRVCEDGLRRDLENPRFTVQELRVEDADLGRVPCERIDFVALDRGVPWAPGQVFVLRGYDLVCVHPAAPRSLLVRIGTSQRYAEGRTPLPIDAELAPFIQSLRFTSPH
jgi:hypothetical protein